MSTRAKDRKQFGDAIKLAEAATLGHHGASPQVTAILHLRVGQAYALAGEVKPSRTAIDAAQNALSSTPPETGNPTWAYWLTESQMHEMIGYSYMWLEDWNRAETHLTASLDDHARAGVAREVAPRQTFLARVHAHRQEPEQACAVASGAIGLLAGDVDSDRCIGHVRRVQELLTPWHTLGVVRDFNDQAERLVAPTSSPV